MTTVDYRRAYGTGIVGNGFGDDTIILSNPTSLITSCHHLLQD